MLLWNSFSSLENIFSVESRMRKYKDEYYRVQFLLYETAAITSEGNMVIFTSAEL